MGTSSVAMGAQARGSSQGRRSTVVLHLLRQSRRPESKVQHGPVGRQALFPAGRLLLLGAGEASLAPVLAHEVVVGEPALRGGRALLVQLGFGTLAARLLLGDARALLRGLGPLRAGAGLLTVLCGDRLAPLLELALAPALEAPLAHARQCDHKCDEDQGRNYSDDDDRAGGHDKTYLLACTAKVPEPRGGKQQLARSRSPVALPRGRTRASACSPSRSRCRPGCAGPRAPRAGPTARSEPSAGRPASGPRSRRPRSSRRARRSGSCGTRTWRACGRRSRCASTPRRPARRAGRARPSPPSAALSAPRSPRSRPASRRASG